jgi:hypothetical protein
MSYLDPIKEAQAVAALKESLGALLNEGDPELLIDTIEGETSLLEAIDRLVLTVAESDGLANGARLAEAEIEHRAERFRKRAESARAMIEQALMIAEIDKLERPGATLSLVRRAPKLELTEESEIPSEFWKTGDPKLDKKALAAALKEGRAVPGAVLSNCAPSLTIRTA